MLESEIFEYLGSGLKVPTEINGFLLSRFSSFCFWYKEALIESRNPFISVGTFNPEPRYSKISLSSIIA